MTARAKTKDELIEQLGHASRVSQNRTQLFDELAAKRLGIGLTDLRCLDIAERLGRPTVGVLAEEAGLTSGAMTALVDRMVAAGFLRRLPDECDRRRVRIELTDSAREQMGAIWGPLQQQYNAMMAHYSNDQLRLVLNFMARGEEVGARLIAWLREAP